MKRFSNYLRAEQRILFVLTCYVKRQSAFCNCSKWYWNRIEYKCSGQYKGAIQINSWQQNVSWTIIKTKHSKGPFINDVIHFRGVLDPLLCQAISSFSLFVNGYPMAWNQQRRLLIINWIIFIMILLKSIKFRDLLEDFKDL